MGTIVLTYKLRRVEMSTTRLVQGVRQVKPIISLNPVESRRRVLNLYKAWYRQIPQLMHTYDLPYTKEQYHAKLREKFDANKHVTDIRAIDLLVIKGQQELMECLNVWSQKTHIGRWFKTTENPRPTDFLSKFYDGHE